MKYWKVVLRYGHVGFRKEISVERYLATQDSVTIVDVREVASNMPGVKSYGVHSIEGVTYEKYDQGKQRETCNFFLQRLFKCKKKWAG